MPLLLMIIFRRRCYAIATYAHAITLIAAMPLRALFIFAAYFDGADAYATPQFRRFLPLMMLLFAMLMPLFATRQYSHDATALLMLPCRHFRCIRRLR